MHFLESRIEDRVSTEIAWPSLNERETQQKGRFCQFPTHQWHIRKVYHHQSVGEWPKEILRPKGERESSQHTSSFIAYCLLLLLRMRVFGGEKNFRNLFPFIIKFKGTCQQIKFNVMWLLIYWLPVFSLITCCACGVMITVQNQKAIRE